MAVLVLILGVINPVGVIPKFTGVRTVKEGSCAKKFVVVQIHLNWSTALGPV